MNLLFLILFFLIHSVQHDRKCLRLQNQSLSPECCSRFIMLWKYLIISFLSIRINLFCFSFILRWFSRKIPPMIPNLLQTVFLEKQEWWIALSDHGFSRKFFNFSQKCWNFEELKVQGSWIRKLFQCWKELSNTGITQKLVIICDVLKVEWIQSSVSMSEEGSTYQAL